MKTRSILFVPLCGLLLIPSQVALKAQAVYSTPAAPSGTRSNLAPASSGDLNEVLKLVQSGVDESVTLAYVQNSPVANHPSADEILKLREAGVSPRVLSAILQRGGELRAQGAQMMAAAAANAAQTPPQQQSGTGYSTPTDSAPSTVVYANTYPSSYASSYGYSSYYPYYYPYSYSYYPYSYSSYPYAYSYYPYYRYPFYFNASFGNGFHHHHGSHFTASLNSRGPWSPASFNVNRVNNFNHGNQFNHVNHFNNAGRFNNNMNNFRGMNGTQFRGMPVGGARVAGAPMRAGGAQFNGARPSGFSQPRVSGAPSGGMRTGGGGFSGGGGGGRHR